MNKTYLSYIETPSATGKTKIVKIYNAADDKQSVLLATIKWFGAWRKYCLFTEADIVFDNNCLNEILQKLLELNSKGN